MIYCGLLVYRVENMLRPSLISVILACSVLFPAAAIGNPNSLQPADIAAKKLMSNGQQDPKFLRMHQSHVAIAKQGTAELVFIGDSITFQWSRKDNVGLFNQEFGKYNPVNFGIGTDRTQHVLWRVTNGAFDGIKPKVVVLMIGTNNNRSATNTPERIASGIEKIIDAIHSRSPDTKILLHAIFPRGAIEPNKKNEQVNALIANFEDGRRVHFMNINKAFLGPTGTVSRATMPDLLHLSTDGYRAWANAIRPKLQELFAGAASRR